MANRPREMAHTARKAPSTPTPCSPLLMDRRVSSTQPTKRTSAATSATVLSALTSHRKRQGNLHGGENNDASSVPRCPLPVGECLERRLVTAVSVDQSTGAPRRIVVH